MNYLFERFYFRYTLSLEAGWKVFTAISSVFLAGFKLIMQIRNVKSIVNEVPISVICNHLVATMKKVLILMRKLTKEAIKKALKEKIPMDQKVARKKGLIIVTKALATKKVQAQKVVLSDLELT